METIRIYKIWLNKKEFVDAMIPFLESYEIITDYLFNHFYARYGTQYTKYNQETALARSIANIWVDAYYKYETQKKINQQSLETTINLNNIAEQYAIDNTATSEQVIKKIKNTNQNKNILDSFNDFAKTKSALNNFLDSFNELFVNTISANELTTAAEQVDINKKDIESLENSTDDLETRVGKLENPQPLPGTIYLQLNKQGYINPPPWEWFPDTSSQEWYPAEAIEASITRNPITVWFYVGPKN